MMSFLHRPNIMINVLRAPSLTEVRLAPNITQVGYVEISD